MERPAWRGGSVAGPAGDRTADRRHRGAAPRPARRAGADRRPGRGLPRRCRCRARLPGPPRPDGRAVRPRSMATWRPALPDGGPGALPAGWRGRAPGPDRLPGEDPRLPRGARGDRGRARSAPGRARGRGGGPRRRRREAPGGLHRGGRRGAGPARPAAGASAAASAGLHGAGGLRGGRELPADAERQGRPAGPGPGRRRAGGRHSRSRRPAHARGGAAGRDLGRGPGARRRGCARQLLRARRPLAAGHPGGLPGAVRVRRRAAVAGPVREPDRRTARPDSRGRSGLRCGPGAADRAGLAGR